MTKYDEERHLEALKSQRHAAYPCTICGCDGYLDPQNTGKCVNSKVAGHQPVPPYCDHAWADHQH